MGISAPAANPAPSRTSVHPGWLVADRLEMEEPTNESEESSLRFDALSSLLRTAGALDRAACDILGDLGLTAGAFFALLELRAVSPTGIAPSELARHLTVVPGSP